MDFEETPINQLVLDVWFYILKFLNTLDIIVLQYVNKQISNNVTECQPWISKVNYLLEYFAPLNPPRRDKKTVSKYTMVPKSIIHHLIDISRVLTNCGFTLSLREICCKIIMYGHLQHTKSMAYLIQTQRLYFEPYAFDEVPSGEKPSGDLNMSRIHDYLFLVDTDFTVLCKAAIQTGNIKKLKALIRANPRYHHCEAICESIASVGNLNILHWVRTQKYFIGNHSCLWNEKVCAAAAKNGHLGVLQWALDNGCTHDIRIKIYAEKYGHTHLLPLVNKYYGHDLVGPTMYATDTYDINLLKWYLDRGYQWTDDTCIRAIVKGHKQIINTAYHLGYRVVPNIYELALEHGHLKIMKWAHKNNIPIELNNVLILVARVCVKKCNYMINNKRGSHYYGLGTDNLNIIQRYANIFEWLCLNKMDQREYQAWLQTNFTETPKMTTQMIAWYISHYKATTMDPIPDLCDYMIGSRNLELLQWAHKYGFQLPHNLCLIIANIDRSRVPADILRKMLVWAHTVGFHMDEKVCTLAAANHDYKMLTWAAECGCNINLDENMSSYSWGIEKVRDITHRRELYDADNLELLKWLIDWGFTWDSQTICLASNAGLKSIIEYAANKQKCVIS